MFLSFLLAFFSISSNFSTLTQTYFKAKLFYLCYLRKEHFQFFFTYLQFILFQLYIN